MTELYAQIGKLTTQVEWLKKNLASTLSRAERQALLDRGPDAARTLAQAAAIRQAEWVEPPVIRTDNRPPLMALALPIARNILPHGHQAMPANQRS